MITGYGVAEAVHNYYTIYGGEVKVKAIVQGFGNVGSAAFLFSRNGSQNNGYHR
jgi:glutamate dehydrogenase/leucine dehydrogenase